MNWYYVSDGQRVGPVSQEQFDALVAGGTIALSTMVWREGMPQWQTWSVVQSAPAAAAAPVVSAAPVAGGQQRCSQCGLVHSQDDMIQYEGAWVCATCKPAFLQRLREGAQVGAAGLGAVAYAGFWIRFVAVLIDGIILFVVNTLVRVVAGLSAVAIEQEPFTGVTAFVMLLQTAVGISYTTFFLGKFGATLGKMALGLKVVVSDGTPVSYLRAFGRYWAYVLSCLTCTIGFIIAGFDREKRALHDHICNTRVIKSR